MSAPFAPVSDTFLDAPRVPFVDSTRGAPGDRPGTVGARDSLAVREVVGDVVRGLLDQAGPGGGTAEARPAVRYYHDSEFVSDFTLRVPLTPVQRGMIKAGLKRDRARGKEGLTKAAAAIGFELLGIIGSDGRLNPSLAYLAGQTGYCVATAERAIKQLRTFGYLDWTRQIVRTKAGTVRQTSNAYVLKVPAAKTPGTHFAHESALRINPKRFSKRDRVGEAIEVAQSDRAAFENGARCLELLGQHEAAANLRARAPS